MVVLHTSQQNLRHDVAAASNNTKVQINAQQKQQQQEHLRPVYSDTTQLNSMSSCHHVHSVNNCQRSVLIVVTQWGCP